MDYLLIGLQFFFVLIVALSRASIGFRDRINSRVQQPISGRIVFEERFVFENEEEAPDTLRSARDSMLPPPMF